MLNGKPGWIRTFIAMQKQGRSGAYVGRLPCSYLHCGGYVTTMSGEIDRMGRRKKMLHVDRGRSQAGYLYLPPFMLDRALSHNVRASNAKTTYR